MGIYLEMVYKFFENYYIYIISGFLILYAVYCYVKYDTNILSRIQKSLRNINEALKEVIKGNPDNLGKINKIFENNAHDVLNDIWNSYNSVYTACPGRTHNIRGYFNTNSVIVFPGNRKKMEATPTTIVLFGILGVFIRMIMSIIKIDLSAGGLSDEILATLLKLGVEVFFISTIVIGIYITLKHSDRQVYQNTVKELYKFCDLTEVRIQTEKDLVNLAMLLEEQKKHTQILKKYPAKAGAFLKDFAINSLTPILKETFEEAISSFFAPSIDEMRETIVKLSQYAIKSQQSGTRKMVDEFMKKLSTATKEHLISAENNIITLSKFARGMGENLRIHMDQMQKIIVMHKELSENSWAIVKNMSENHDEVLNSNREMIRVLEKTSILADSISDILKANGEMMDKLNQEKLSLQNENNQYFDNMNEQNRKLNEELNFRTNDIFMRFTDITENVINKFDENMGRAIGSFEENIKLTIGSLDEQSRNISLYANELSTDIGELNNNLNNSAKVFGDNIHEGVVKTFDDFDNGLAEICERLGTTINSIKDMTEYLPEMLKIFTVEIKKLRDN